MAVNLPGGAMGPPVYGGGNLPYGGTQGLSWPSSGPGTFGSNPPMMQLSGGGGTSGYAVPPQGTGFPPSSGNVWTGAGGGPILGGGLFSVEQPAYPGVANPLAAYLGANVGKGVTPFNLGTPLPFGGTTAPGQLSANANPLLQSLFGGLQGQSTNIPGFNTLSTIANQGISALPEWQNMVAAQGQNIAQNEAQLREQFGSMGNLAGSPFGSAMSNYMQGTTAQQNALLGQLQQQNILQGQIPVAQGLMGAAANMGQYAQAVNQQAIMQKLNEFIRVSPQYNPLLQAQLSMSQTYDPVLNRAGMTSPSLLSSLIGPAIGGIAGGATAAAGGATTMEAILAGLAAI